MLMGLGLHTVQLLFPRKVINSGLCSIPEHLPRGLQGARAARVLLRGISPLTSPYCVCWAWQGLVTGEFSEAKEGMRLERTETKAAESQILKSGERICATWLMIHAVEVALFHAWFVKEDYELANVRP